MVVATDANVREDEPGVTAPVASLATKLLDRGDAQLPRDPQIEQARALIGR